MVIRFTELILNDFIAIFIVLSGKSHMDQPIQIRYHGQIDDFAIVIFAIYIEVYEGRKKL